MLWGILNAFYFENENIFTFSWIVNSDWMMHLTQVQNFSELPFWEVATHHPIYSGDILSYPFFINFVSGVLLFLTGNIVFAMQAPMILGTFLFLFSVYFLFFVLLENRFTAVVAFFLFFFTGGLQFLDFFSLWTFDQFQSLYDFSFDQQLVKLGYHWKSFFLTTLLPQRAYLWGIIVGSFSLFLFFQRFISFLQSEKKDISFSVFQYTKNELSQFFIIGLLLGFLSVVHTHSFLYIVLLFFGLTIFYIRYIIIFLSIAGGALITSFPFLCLLFHKKNTISEISFFPLEQLAQDSFFHFWHLNLGIFFWSIFLFFIPFIWNFIFGEEKSERKTLLIRVFLITFILFIAFSFIKMQSNPWDNTKLWLWNVLFFSLFFSSFLTALWQKSILGKIISAVIFFFSIISGIIMLISGLNDIPTQVFSKNDLFRAEEAKTIVLPSDIIMTSDYFHLPFTVLVPKQIFLGYRGWISSYGMNTKNKIALLERVYSGGPNAIQILKRENIRYVLLDDSARSIFLVNDSFFQNEMQVVIDLKEWGKLYEIRNK